MTQFVRLLQAASAHLKQARKEDGVCSLMDEWETTTATTQQPTRLDCASLRFAALRRAVFLLRVFVLALLLRGANADGARAQAEAHGALGWIRAARARRNGVGFAVDTLNHTVVEAMRSSDPAARATVLIQYEVGAVVDAGILRWRRHLSQRVARLR